MPQSSPPSRSRPAPRSAPHHRPAAGTSDARLPNSRENSIGSQLAHLGLHEFSGLIRHRLRAVVDPARPDVAVGRTFAVPFAFGDARVAAGAAARYCSLFSDQLGGEEETAMPTYIAFGNWTDQGVRAIAESPQRLDAAKRQ